MELSTSRSPLFRKIRLVFFYQSLAREDQTTPRENKKQLWPQPTLESVELGIPRWREEIHKSSSPTISISPKLGPDSALSSANVSGNLMMRWGLVAILLPVALRADLRRLPLLQSSSSSSSPEDRPEETFRTNAPVFLKFIGRPDGMTPNASAVVPSDETSALRHRVVAGKIPLSPCGMSQRGAR